MVENGVSGGVPAEVWWWKIVDTSHKRRRDEMGEMRKTHKIVCVGV